MRVAMLSWRSPGDPQRGGAETLTLEVLRNAVARGHEATWFGARYPGSLSSEVIDGIRIVRKGRQWTVHFHAWRWVRANRETFDVIVDQVNTIPFLTPLYVRQSQRYMLIFQTAREYWWHQTQGVFRLLSPLGYIAEPQYLKAYRRTRAITISSSTRDELVDLGLKREAITILPMAISTQPLDKLEAKPLGMRVITIGRLARAKHVDEAIKAFALVHGDDPESQLDIVGGGDAKYREELEMLVVELGLSKAVRFHGIVSEPAKIALLDRAHIHLFASHREGWGLTVTEAASRGTPTVAYDAPGVKDAVGDARLLSPLKSGPKGLADVINKLSSDAATYTDLREKAWQASCLLSYEATTDVFLAAVHG